MDPLQLDEVLTNLRLLPFRGVFAHTWDATSGGLTAPAPGLMERFVDDAARSVRMSRDVREACLGDAGVMRRSRHLSRLFAHMHRRLCRRDPCPRREVLDWPPAEEGALPPMYYALVFLACFPSVWAEHGRRGIPASVTDATLSDLERWVHAYRERKGRYGFGEKSWLYHHVTGGLFQLGRLQYLLDRFAADLDVYQNRASGEVVCLAPDGRRVRYDGQFDGTDGFNDPEAFVTLLRKTDRSVSGNPVNPRGYIERRVVSLDVDRWSLLFGKGATAISVHIPENGPLDPDECGASLETALAFFERYFAHHRVTCFFSRSWLYDPQLEQYLPAGSNIVRFMREWYLHPVEDAGDRQFRERVLERPPYGEGGRRKETTLQRVLRDHMSRGGLWHDGGALIVGASLRWGARAYRSGVLHASSPAPPSMSAFLSRVGVRGCR